MPLPLVHLSVARRIEEKLAADIPQMSGPELYLGSIAPDAIHMREGWTRADKQRVHLFDMDRSLGVRFGRIDRLMHELEGSIGEPMLYGWVSHLAADTLWAHYVIHGFYDNHLESQSPESRAPRYYRETDKIEYLMYRTLPWRTAMWRTLSVAKPESVGDYLTAEEIGRWRDRFLRWHVEIGEEPDNFPELFTMDRIDAFIDMAVIICERGFRSKFADTVTWLQEMYAADFIEMVRHR